ncbi:thermostable hemolysin [Vibrio ostreicida]|uniref:Thermostable hemolysin n=1 Tax=Vibrio ostreicida TaxID=526588 RepID=A0ABT8BP42_9VIBR|nr:thermostable hemolysin [Vibrio ostreicida]MDN3608532.1 thermostable hemolysin [Vibrio ostreicida]NPD10665.1 hypothetical protein [Vibrio ostreicida]
MNIKIIKNSDPLALKAREATREKYEDFYKANIDPNPEYYVIASKGFDKEFDVSSCAGISFKNKRKLFSEQYLDKSIEEVIVDNWGRYYSSDKIAEIGGLISNHHHVGIKLTTLIPFIAHCVGASVLLCTITQTVSRLLSSCGIKFEPICKAQEECLELGKGDWGSYYESKPVTGVIFLDDHSAMFKALSMSINFDYNNEQLKLDEAA